LAVFDGAAPQSCDCPDHARHPELTCKHLAAATIYRAKTRAKARREHSTNAQRPGRHAQASRLWRRACDPGDTNGGGVRATLARPNLHLPRIAGRGCVGCRVKTAKRISGGVEDELRSDGKGH
jgi:hypothetical protein